MSKKLTVALVTIMVFVIGFTTLANNTTVYAQTSQEEMQSQIDELRELVNILVLTLSGNQQGQNNQAGIPNISSQRARDIAVEFIGNGTSRDVLLFTENNVLMFEVEINHENVRYMVYINASDGDVIRMSRHEMDFQGITTLPEVIAPIPTPQPQPQPQPSPNPSPGDNRNNRPSNPAISLERAIEIARTDLVRRGLSGTLRNNASMDWERGQWVWEIEFRSSNRGEYEFYINVHTGTIVKFEWDR